MNLLLEGLERGNAIIGGRGLSQDGLEIGRTSGLFGVLDRWLFQSRLFQLLWWSGGDLESKLQLGLGGSV